MDDARVQVFQELDRMVYYLTMFTGTDFIVYY